MIEKMLIINVKKIQLKKTWNLHETYFLSKDVREVWYVFKKF
jgi:hypothetical protein